MWYTQTMKSTTDTKKTIKGKQSKVSNYRFWLVLSCAGLVGVWYMFMLLTFFGTAAVINSNIADSNYALYDLLLNASSILAIFIASFASLPFAVAVFKRLNIEMPVRSGIAFFMAPTFGFTLFSFLSGVVFYEPSTIYLVLTVSVIIAGLVYGLIIRYLKHRLSNVKFLSIAIGLAFLPIVLWYLYRLGVTTQF